MKSHGGIQVQPREFLNSALESIDVNGEIHADAPLNHVSTGYKASYAREGLATV